MSLSEARKKANAKYNAKAYEQIQIRVRKDDKINKAVITKNADKANESVNEYIIKSIKQRIESGK